MNRDDIIRMAREAGFRIGPSRSGPDDVWGVGATLERFAALVAAAERESCAKLCEAEGERVRDLHDRLDDGCIDALLGKELSAKRLAEAIRARGQG